MGWRQLIALAGLSAYGVVAAENPDRVPGLPVNPQRDVYYGDLHLHTSYSFDAYLLGARVDPDGAYRFACDEPGVFLNEKIERLSVPLDFAAVTDHAELIGVAATLEDPASRLSRSKIGRVLQKKGIGAVTELGWPSGNVSLPQVDTKAIARSAWQRVIEAANRHYRPGKFSTFIAYEWTAQQGARHLHRNIIFRGSEAPAPFTASDSSRPEDLWAYLEAIRQQGHEALAIPHNSNLSGGLAFQTINSDGKPIDDVYARLRSANEPLVEIVQNKGQSEVHPLLSPNDELANFEIMDSLDQISADELPGSYVRDALGRGLEIMQRNGVTNPYKYGFAGASDFHNGLSDSAEAAYSGVFGAVGSKALPADLGKWAVQWVHRKMDAELKHRIVSLSSAGLTGVWAEQNTRESLYAALRRKETFATSGTRLKLRFFGGWDFPTGLLQRKDWIDWAYRLAVPMGGDLPPTKDRGVPHFVVWSLKDPNGANLERLQIVKVWLEEGYRMERVYDVASCKADVCTRGAVELAATWIDPTFDPTEPAAYYLRTIEIPTPRWTTIAAGRRGEPPPSGVPSNIQERGWSSPIWYGAPAKTGGE